MIDILALEKLNKKQIFFRVHKKIRGVNQPQRLTLQQVKVLLSINFE